MSVARSCLSRPVHITLPLPSPLAAMGEAASFQIGAHSPMRITECTLFLQGLGVGPGATEVDVKVNGKTIFGQDRLSIPAGAHWRRVREAPAEGLCGEPPGVAVNADDCVSLDITVVPRMAPRGGYVVISGVSEGT